MFQLLYVMEGLEGDEILFCDEMLKTHLVNTKVLNIPSTATSDFVGIASLVQ